MAVTRRRDPVLVLAALLLFVTSFLASTASADLVNKTGQVTVFWGRHKEEGSLREACDSGMYTVVIISFLNVYGRGSYHLDLSGHPLAGIGNDIKHCQSKGVAVSLSIGGFGGDYSLPTKRSALDLFDHLWNAYLGGSKKGVRRPFGDAWLDGVDLFLEHGTPAERYEVLAMELAKRNIRGGPGKPLHLTATTRCAFPDRPAVKKALDTGVFERIHVRFYGDARCSYNKAGMDGVMEQWDKWTSRYPKSKVYLGLVGANVTTANGGDMVGVRALYYGLLPAVKRAANYGGVMLWDRYLDEQTYYGQYLKAWA